MSIRVGCCGIPFTEKDLQSLKEKCSEDCYCLFNNVSMEPDA